MDDVDGGKWIGGVWEGGGGGKKKACFPQMSKPFKEGPYALYAIFHESPQLLKQYQCLSD